MVVVDSYLGGKFLSRQSVRQVMDAWLLTEDGKLKPEYGGTPSSVEATAREE